MRELLRRIRTYRRYRIDQLAGRALAEVRRRLRLTRVPQPPDDLRGFLERRTSFLHHDPWNERVGLRQGRVAFLNRPRDMGTPWDWDAQEMSLLWRYHLHSFEYLFLLERDERRDLCLQWIAANSVGHGAGWHPYPTSLRISNWCKLLSRESPTSIDQSLYQQAGFLSRNLEKYLSGNHLVENARALVLAGLYFSPSGESPRWLDMGLDIFRRELPSQILPDGGHYERSVMYHARVLQACLDVLNALPSESEACALFSNTAHQMLPFLRGMTHPDGCFALFNDTTVEGGPSTGSLVGYAASLDPGKPTSQIPKRPFRAFPHSGFYRYSGNGLSLVLDAGSIGPQHQPAHGHADALTYELSVHGTRVISDTGVDGYAESDVRNYCRSTRAHNTIEVDGTDQAEVWGDFRVGRSFAPIVEKAELEGSSFQFCATFRGYEHLVGDAVVHRRSIECDAGAQVLRVNDRIGGRGRHRVLSRIHLHPDVHVTSLSDHRFRIDTGDVVLEIRVSTAARLERGLYCPRFGVRRDRWIVCIGGDVELPVSIAYELNSV